MPPKPVKRALAAQSGGAFANEIVPVKVSTRKGDVEYLTDEQPSKCDVSKIASLKPAFRKENGTITAASSSSISDGAAATVLMSADEAARRGVAPLARIAAHATHAQEPQWFTTAPVGAIEKLLKKAGWSVSDVDLFEVNEAFAVVAMAPMRELGISHDKRQRQRRRLRARSSDRRERRAPRRHADPRAEESRPRSAA